ncbi:MAG TPA: hypothetical protein VKK79_09540 [Candidatus Lokiarchaeia archaeon]|nr:hypothetical protein [Candidatus Lokiarchaeia archaeon]
MPIEEIFIITNAGVCIYSKSRKVTMDKNIIAGFLTALNSFSKEMSKEPISSIVLNNFRFTFSAFQNLLFIIRTDIASNQAVIEENLMKIQNIFFKFYPPENFPKEWDQYVENSMDLDAQYEKFFLNVEEKLLTDLW